MKKFVQIKNGTVVDNIPVEDGTYNITLNKKCDDHTIEQVKKLWATIDAISMKLYGNKSESEGIYLQILKDSGIRTTKVFVPEQSIPQLKKAVRCLHILARDVVDHVAMVVCDCCMVGVSEMDKKELSQVIETSIRYAAEAGVETELRNDG